MVPNLLPLGTTLEGLEERENSQDGSQLGFGLPASDLGEDCWEGQKHLEAGKMAIGTALGTMGGRENRTSRLQD